MTFANTKLYEWSIYKTIRKINIRNSMTDDFNQSCNEASKIFDLRRFLSEDPSSSLSSVHFQMLKNLRSFEDLKPKIPKIFGKNLHSFGKNCPTNSKKYVHCLKKCNYNCHQRNFVFHP